MTPKEFVPDEQALALKELGFNEPCFGYWNIDPSLPTQYLNPRCEPFKHDWCLPAPLYQQAFRWFREKYDLPNHIDTYWQHDWNDYSYQWYIKENHIAWNSTELYKSYEEAELACLIKLIEIVKNGK